MPCGYTNGYPAREGLVCRWCGLDGTCIPCRAFASPLSRSGLGDVRLGVSRGESCASGTHRLGVTAGDLECDDDASSLHPGGECRAFLTEQQGNSCCFFSWLPSWREPAAALSWSSDSMSCPPTSVPSLAALPRGLQRSCQFSSVRLDACRGTVGSSGSQQPRSLAAEPMRTSRGG